MLAVFVRIDVEMLHFCCFRRITRTILAACGAAVLLFFSFPFVFVWFDPQHNLPKHGILQLKAASQQEIATPGKQLPLTGSSL